MFPFCFLTADSIKFTNKYYLEPYLEFLKSEEKNGVVGFDIENRIPWEGYMQKTNAFEITPSKDFINFDYLRLKQVDICRNFFLAKTIVLYLNKWDENLKLCEHEDWAWRLKTETSYKVFYSALIRGYYINDKPDQYLKLRNRCYQEFKKFLLKKWNIVAPFRLRKEIK